MRPRKDLVRPGHEGLRRALTPSVIDILYLVGVLALVATVALLARGVERL